MKIVKHAAAGTLESSDLLVRVEPDEKDLTVEIDSVVGNQYYEAIEHAVNGVLEELQVETGRFFIKDRGALDCVIRARMETAVKRGGAEK